MKQQLIILRACLIIFLGSLFSCQEEQLNRELTTSEVIHILNGMVEKGVEAEGIDNFLIENFEYTIVEGNAPNNGRAECNKETGKHTYTRTDLPDGGSSHFFEHCNGYTTATIFDANGDVQATYSCPPRGYCTALR